MAACYARGAPRPFDPARGGASLLCRAIRVEGASLDLAAEAAKEHGLWAEALLLRDSALLDWAEQALSRGLLITSESLRYPKRLLARIGPAAPPVLWRRGLPPDLPFLTIVGSREPSPEAVAFAEGCAREAVGHGYAISSGGARGIDRVATSAVCRIEGAEPPVVEVLPYGLEHWRPGLTCLLSMAAPKDDFSRSLAMERNLVLYAMADAAIVVESRFKEGGTWHGAIQGLRRRLTRVLIRSVPQNPAHAALASLGAEPLVSPDELGRALAADPMQRGLAY